MAARARKRCGGGEEVVVVHDVGVGDGNDGRPATRQVCEECVYRGACGPRKDDVERQSRRVEWYGLFGWLRFVPEMRRCDGVTV